MNPEFQFPEFKALQSGFILIRSYIGIFFVYCDINLNLLPCNNTQKVKKQKNVANIQNSYWLFKRGNNQQINFVDIFLKF